MVATVRVTGMREVRAALKNLGDAERQGELKEANIKIANFVVAGARSRAGSRMQSSTASRMRASKTVGRASVLMGGRPFDMGANFGAFHNQPRVGPSGRRFLGYNWAPSISKPDHMLYRTIEAETGRIVDLYGDAMEKIWNRGP